jgi:hypothetical protein
VWNYFREKLLLRLDPSMGPFLRAADAYIWSCYEPVLRAQRAANPTQPFREPPLVTFDADVSPWAQSRRTPSEAATHGSSSGIDDEIPMPIAVLGIPWSMLERLPNLASLAHETGHIIETDFGLVAPLQAALLEATKNSALNEGWSQHWRKEVFADLFACFAAGPSAVWTLTEAIPEAPFQVETRKRPSDIESAQRWGKYPPATLRVLMNLCALRKLGYAEDAGRIEQYWKADYPKHAMAAYESDVNLVVEAVYGASRLPEELDWNRTTKYYAMVRGDVVGSDLDVSQVYDPRMLVAIAGDLYRAQRGENVSAAWQRLQTHIVKSRPPGILAGQKERTQPGAPVFLRTEEIARTLFADDPPQS